MKYVYRNISGADAISLLNGVPNKQDSRSQDFVTAAKCRIANTSGADITVDVYIEIQNLATRELDSAGETLFSESDKYHFIKNLVIPLGTAIDIVSNKSCTFERSHSFKILLSDGVGSADVIFEYDITKNYNSRPSSGSTRTPNVRDY